jgi:hypothetical protein
MYVGIRQNRSGRCNAGEVKKARSLTVCRDAANKLADKVEAGRISRPATALLPLGERATLCGQIAKLLLIGDDW